MPRKASEPESVAGSVVYFFDLEKLKSAVFTAKKEVKEETWNLLNTVVRGFREAGACIASA